MARVTLTDEGLEYAEAAGLVVDDGGETTDSDDETATFDGLGAGFNDVEDVTVAEKLEPADWQAGKGHVVDGDGSILPYVCEKTDPFADVREGDTVALQNVKVRDSNEGPTLVLSGVTRVENQTRAAGQSGLDSADTVADGGTDTATADNSADETDGTPDGSGGPTELVSVAIEAVEACVERGAADDPAKHGEVVSWITEHTDLTLHRADEAIDEAQTRGAIQAVADGEYRST